MRGILATFALVIGLLMLGAAPATAAPGSGPQGPPLPVSYNFLGNGIANQLADPNGSPPGTNDWSCTPSARHPNPVILVHGGLANRQLDWGVYGPVLHNAGYCTYALNWGVNPDFPQPFNGIAGLSSIRTDAGPSLDRFVQRVLRTTGAKKVDLVAHSLGSLVNGYYINVLGGQQYVQRVVTIAGLWKGSGISGPGGTANQVDGCGMCSEVSEGSPLVNAINAGGTPYRPGIAYTNIATRYDEMAIPYTNGIIPGRPGQDVTNIVVQDGCDVDFSEHQAIAGSRRGTIMVLNALDPEHQRTVPCEIVLPSTGMSIGPPR